MLHFECPHCQTSLTAPPEDAGNQIDCPICGKPLAVPAGSAERQDHQPLGNSAEGMGGEIGFDCPFCNTRAYAPRSQQGSTIVCADCLETIAVPAASTTASAENTTPAPASPTPANPTPATPASEFVDDGDDSLPLALEPSPAEGQDDGAVGFVTEPKDAITPQTTSPVGRDLVPDQGPDQGPSEPDPDDGGDENRISDLDDEYTLEAPITTHHTDRIGKGMSEDDQELLDESLPGAPVPEEPKPKKPRQMGFTVKCTVCDTAIVAKPEEIGSEKTCPDCGSPITITKPKEKDVQEVTLDDLGESGFTLKPADEPTVFKEMAEKAEKKVGQGAEGVRVYDEAMEMEKRRDEERKFLPDNPLFNGVFKCFLDLNTWGCLITITVIMGLLAASSQGTYYLGATGNPLAVFTAILLSVITVVMTLFGGLMVAMMCLAMLQSFAEGNDEVRDFPGFQVMEYFGEAIYVFVAMTYSISPALLALFLACLLPPQITAMMIPVCGFAFFPVVLLSMQEAASLATPINRVVLKSFQDHAKQWGMFYGLTFGLLIVMSVFALGTTLVTESVLIISLVFGLTCGFGFTIYFRLLGRMTWWLSETME